MQNTLVVFTPRCGSTYLNDLLAIEHGNVNLDEFMHASVRANYKEELPPNIRYIIDPLQTVSYKDYVTTYGLVKGSKLYQSKIEAIKSINKTTGVSLKETAHSAFRPVYSFMDYCVDNKFLIYFVYRESLEAQLYSMLCSRIRRKYAEQNNISLDYTFINYKNNKAVFRQLPAQFFHIEAALKELISLIRFIETWQGLYFKYKQHVRLVSYEQYIKDYSIVGVSNKTVQTYRSLPNSVVPFDTGELGSNIINWPQISKHVKYYNTIYQSLKEI